VVQHGGHRYDNEGERPPAVEQQGELDSGRCQYDIQTDPYDDDTEDDFGEILFHAAIMGVFHSDVNVWLLYWIPILSSRSMTGFQ
jgi:hypothetical protein